VLKLYRFIYYKIYKFCIGLGKKDIPERKAVAILSLWIMFYLGLPYALLVHFNNVRTPKVVFAMIFVAINIIQFFALINTRKHVRIYYEFEKNLEYQKRNKMVVPLFLAFPFAILLLFMITIWS
jgi:hypothetical protein